MGKAKNERFVIRDDVFHTGDHEVFRFHKKKGCFKAEKVLSLNESVLSSFHQEFASVCIDTDEKGRPAVLSSCRFSSGRKKESFFAVVKGARPSEYILNRYGLSDEDFLLGEDDLSSMERLQEFLSGCRNLVFYSRRTGLDVIQEYQLDLRFSYIELLPVLKVLYPGLDCYSIEEFEKRFSLVREPLVKENDVISLGRIFLSSLYERDRKDETWKKEERIEEKEVKTEDVLFSQPEKKEADMSEKEEAVTEEKAPFLSASKAVDLFDKDGNFVRTFSSVGEASRATLVGNKEIRIACNSEMMKKLNKGYRFQWHR